MKMFNIYLGSTCMLRTIFAKASLECSNKLKFLNPLETINLLLDSFLLTISHSCFPCCFWLSSVFPLYCFLLFAVIRIVIVSPNSSSSSVSYPYRFTSISSLSGALTTRLRFANAYMNNFFAQNSLNSSSCGSDDANSTFSKRLFAFTRTEGFGNISNDFKVSLNDLKSRKEEETIREVR